MAQFTIDPSLDEAGASAAIASAMAAGTLTAAGAGAALAAWMKASGAAKASKPRYTKTAKGAVYFTWGKNQPGIIRSCCLDREGWEKVGKVAAEIVRDWDKIPLSASAADPVGAAAKKAAWQAKKAAQAVA